MNLNKLISPLVTVSIVSHLHGAQLMLLLCKLQVLCTVHLEHVVLTVNVPEQALLAELNSRKWTLNLTIVQNAEPKGFGANHNAAFKHCNSEYFCVLNPDIDFDADPFPALIAHFEQPMVGCVFPVQLNEAGQIQDYARVLPSPIGLFARHLWPREKKHLVTQPDWVNGAFMLFRANIFRQLGGFDERYFMYCEDVDICLRLRLAGYRLTQASARVTHAAHRNSRGNFRHLMWHVVSLLRLWSSAPYRNFSRGR